MSEIEIQLARTYLDLAGSDPVAALIRSVRDLARIRAALLEARDDPQPVIDRSARALPPPPRCHA